MNAPERGALMLVRFIAAALIGWALIDVTLYVVVARHKELPVEILPCVVKSLPAVAGVGVLIKARAISEWLADKLDL
jgi:hypothetical protein